MRLRPAVELSVVLLLSFLVLLQNTEHLAVREASLHRELHQGQDLVAQTAEHEGLLTVLALRVLLQHLPLVYER